MDVTTALVTVAVTVGSLTPIAGNDMPAAGATTVATAAIVASASDSDAPAMDVRSAAGVEQLTIGRRTSMLNMAPPKIARPTALVPLYASFAALQGFDIYTTSKAVSRGADEANPLMKPVAGKSMASVAVKAAATAGSIFFIERAWKQNRKGAVILMTALNVATAAVVAHNTKVTNQSR
jgi:hypothetical protein